MKKVVCIAAKIKKALAPLVENKLSGCEVIWLEELDAEARRKAILRSDIMLASLLTVELSAEEKKLLGRLEMVQTMSAGVDQIDFSTLPENVKKDQIGAKVEHGILTVTLPKYTTEEQKKLAQTIVIE